MERRTLLLLASILISALGTALIWLYVQSADDRARQDQHPVLVWTARVTIPAGSEAERIRSSLVQRTLPAAGLPAGAVTDLGTLDRTTSRQLIFPGEVLLKDHFTTSGINAQLAPGMQAVEVPLTEAARLAGLLRPNAQVAVWFVQNEGTPAGSAVVLIPSARVLSVGSAADTGTSRTTASSLVALEVTGKQAAQLMAAQNRLHLSLLPPGGRGSTADDVPAGTLLARR